MGYIVVYVDNYGKRHVEGIAEFPDGRKMGRPTMTQSLEHAERLCKQLQRGRHDERKYSVEEAPGKDEDLVIPQSVLEKADKLINRDRGNNG
jgi:hypothetical protein